MNNWQFHQIVPARKGMSKPMPEFLLERGLIQDGMPVVLKHNLPGYVVVDPTDSAFHGKLKVRKSKVRIIWAEDNEEHSMSEVARIILNRFHPEGRQRPASGPVFWGTATTSFYDWVQRIKGGARQSMERLFSHEAVHKWAPRLSKDQIRFLQRVDNKTSWVLREEDWGPWHPPDDEAGRFPAGEKYPLLVFLDNEIGKGFLAGEMHLADGSWNWNVAWDGKEKSPFFNSLDMASRSKRPIGLIYHPEPGTFYSAGVGFVSRNSKIGFIISGGPPGVFSGAIDSLFEDVPPQYWTWDEYGRDLRRRAERLNVVREGQSKFREHLLRTYQNRCAITGGTVTETLQAAHIQPYRGLHTNKVTNGILLRADIHLLFDAGLLYLEPGVDDERDIEPRLLGVAKESDYRGYEGKKIHLPDKSKHLPERKALELHRDYALSLVEEGAIT